MKNYISFTLILLISFCCQEVRQSPNIQKPIFNRLIGTQIPVEKAQRWIARYTESRSNRKESSATIPALSFSRLLSIPDNILGVSFHRSISENGDYHILLRTVRESSLTNLEDIIDSETGAIVTEDQFNASTQRYKEKNPFGTWSHFFGQHVFEQAFDKIELIEGISDDYKPQILLFLWRSPQSNGRTQNWTVDVYDASAPCPPTCNTFN